LIARTASTHRGTARIDGASAQRRLQMRASHEQIEPVIEQADAQ